MGDSLQNTIIEFRIICETLFLTFLILKLTNVITWSWWWICTPILCILGLILFFIISMVIIKINGKRRENKIISESN